jgi:hypothetical protein
MKKYLILSFLFLLVAFPIIAKGSTNTASQQAINKETTITPIGNQVKNKNEVKTKNQGEDQQLSVQNQENEELNQEVVQSLNKVSDQVHQLLETVGAKGGIGQQVKEIAQNQIKLQDGINSDFKKLNSRGTIKKLLIGSDKKLTKSMEKKMEQNSLMIQQLEELKIQVQNSGDLQQIQETVESMMAQNTSLQNKIDKENKTNGIFGWLINLFNQ